MALKLLARPADCSQGKCVLVIAHLISIFLLVDLSSVLLCLSAKVLQGGGLKALTPGRATFRARTSKVLLQILCSILGVFIPTG